MDFSSSQSNIVLIVNHKPFAQILKRVLSVGSLADVLSQKYGSGVVILYTDSPETAKDYAQSPDVQIQLLLMDVDALQSDGTYLNGINLLRRLRSHPDTRLKAPAIILCNNAAKIRENPDCCILKRENGHYILEKPFSLERLRDKIKGAQAISDEELEIISEEDCTTVGIITQIINGIDAALCIDVFSPDVVKEAREEFRKGYDDLIHMLDRYLPGYFGTQWKEQVEAWSAQMTSPMISRQTYEQIGVEISQQIDNLMYSVLLALVVEAFRELFHGGAYDIFHVGLIGCKGAIKNFLDNKTNISGIVRRLEKSPWWISLEERLSKIRDQIRCMTYQNLEDGIPLSKEIFEIEAALQAFKAYVKYIKECQSIPCDVEELKSKSKEALRCLDGIALSMFTIKAARNQLEKGFIQEGNDR